MKIFSRIFMSLLFFGLLILIILWITKISLSIFNDSNFFLALSATSTAIAALGGVLLLFITFLTLRETRIQRLSKEKPVITLRIVLDEDIHNFLNINLKNSGGGPAYDIQVTFTPNLPYGDSTINELNTFKRMALLDSNEEIEFFYDSLIDYRDNKNPIFATATVSYYTSPKEIPSAELISREFTLDFEEKIGLQKVNKRSMNDLVKEIEELKHAILLLSLKEGDKNDK